MAHLGNQRRDIGTAGDRCGQIGELTSNAVSLGFEVGKGRSSLRLKPSDSQIERWTERVDLEEFTFDLVENRRLRRFNWQVEVTRANGATLPARG